MNRKLGALRVGFVASMAVWVTVFTLPLQAVQLGWEPNPAEERIAHYTLYAESSEGTYQTNIYERTSIDIGFLLSNLTYALYVTATSEDGLESDRSQGLLFPLLSPPFLTQQPVGKTVATGSRAILFARALSNLPLFFQWWKDGVLLDGQTQQDLVIESASYSDRGLYQVVIFNALGSIESPEVSIVVMDPPRIPSQPPFYDVQVGSRVLFAFGVTGSDLQFQWYKGHYPIDGATNRTLNIQSVTFADAGSYRLRISNPLEALESSDTVLRVWPEFSIIQQPVSIRIPVGDYFRLSVEAYGPPPFTYQWYRDDTLLDGRTSQELFITNASGSDSGNYWVRVSSVIGSVASSYAEVFVEASAEPIIDLSITQSGGQMQISAHGPASSSIDLLVTSDLQNPEWILLEPITTDASGHVDTSYPIPSSGNAFIRAARRQ
jgi:hypothetical protein